MNDTKTVSGAIVHVTDADEAPLVRCLVDIAPKQSGTGTPSPSNVRPFSGWESVDVNVVGKNFAKLPNATNTNTGVTITCTDEPKITFNGTRNGSATVATLSEFTLPSGTYILSGAENGDHCGLQLYNVTQNSSYRDSNGRGVSFTVNDGDQLRWRAYIGANATMSNATRYPLLRLATETDPTYAPYNGHTTTTSLGRTVYGGTLDVVSGVLTAYPFYPSYNGETLNGRWLCDRAVYAEGTTPPTGAQVALISGTGTTYTLTGQEVSTLLGENNVWADSGDVEITYHTDTLGIYNKIYINGRPYFRPNDFEIKREDVYAGEYTTCTGKLIADKIGWKYSDLPMKWDILPDEDLVYLTTLTGAFDILFRDSDGQHTEQVIRRAFTNTPTRTTGPEGTKIWTGVEMEVSFLNTHPINE